MSTIHDFLTALPHPTILRDGLKASAILDAIIFSDARFKHYKFHPNCFCGSERAEYDSGGSDELRIFFLGSMAMIKGFECDSDVSRHAGDDFSVWEGMYKGVPPELDSLLDSIEPDPDDLFLSSREDVTFCTWFVDGQWQCGTMQYTNDEDDGAEGLLSMVCLDGEHYEELASDHHGRSFDLPTIEAIFSGAAVTEAMVAKLNPDRNVEDVLEEIKAI